MWLYPITVALSVAQSFFGKQNTRREGGLALFNLVKAGIGLAALACIAAALGERPDARTVLYGALFGVTVYLAMDFGIRAQKTGPMGLSSALAAFSFVIPALFGILFRHEGLRAAQAVGLCLGTLSVFLMCRPSGGEKPPSRTWAVNIFLTFLCNGIGSVIQLLYGEGEEMSRASFTATGFAVAAVCAALAVALGRRDSMGEGNRRAALLCGAASGLCLGGYQILTLTIAVSEGSGLIFPILSVLTLSLSVLVGRVAFGEKLRPVRLFGVLCALAAVFLLKYRV